MQPAGLHHTGDTGTLTMLASLYFNRTIANKKVRGFPEKSTEGIPPMVKNALSSMSVSMPLGEGWRPDYVSLSAADKSTVLPISKHTRINANNGNQNKSISMTQKLAERYKLRVEDERSDRAKANVLAFERLYRNVFCAQHAVDKGGLKNNLGTQFGCQAGAGSGTEDSFAAVASRPKQAALAHGFSGMVLPTQNALEWAHDRRVDALRFRDNANVANGEIYRVVRYVCAPLTREALFEHIDRLIRARYSMSYLFAYMKHLRRKYKREFPLRGNERRAFTRSIVQRYFDDDVPKKSTDEIYASDENTYMRMRTWCLRYLFDDGCTLHNRRNTRRATLRFVYIFLLMYYSGKRMSELCTLSADNLLRLHTDKHIAIFIPKTRKLGRISYRTIDSHECAEFDAFLLRSVYLFRDCAQSPYRQETVIPFDQFVCRKSLDRYFDRVYARVMVEKKPRGLSFHSLRRRKAAVCFERGVNLDNIREILDHASTRVTNNYINKHLVRSYRTDKRHGTNAALPPAAPIKKTLMILPFAEPGMSLDTGVGGKNG